MDLASIAGRSVFHPQTDFQVLIPTTCQCDFIWKWDLCRVIQVEMRSYWSRVDPNPYKSEMCTQKTQTECHVMTDRDRSVSTSRGYTKDCC